jgi:hypothetical protein
MATRIDTLKTYEAIAAAGVDDKAARAISNAIAEAATDWRADLATKSDLDAMMAATKADLDSMRAGTKADLDSMRAGTKADFDTMRAGTKAELDSMRAGTKADFDTMRSDMNSGLALLKRELETTIANTQNRTLIWMFGMLLTFSGVILAGFKFL